MNEPQKTPQAIVEDSFREALRMLAEKRLATHPVEVPQTLDAKILRITEEHEQRKMHERRRRLWRRGAKAAGIVLACALALHTFLYYNVEAYRLPVQQFFVELRGDGVSGHIDTMDAEGYNEYRAELGQVDEGAVEFHTEGRLYPPPEAFFTDDKANGVVYETDPKTLAALYAVFPYDVPVPDGFELFSSMGISATDGEFEWRRGRDMISFSYMKKEYDAEPRQYVWPGQIVIDTEYDSSEDIYIGHYHGIMTSRVVNDLMDHQIIWEDDGYVYLINAWYDQTAPETKAAILEMVHGIAPNQ